MKKNLLLIFLVNENVILRYYCQLKKELIFIFGKKFLENWKSNDNFFNCQCVFLGHTLTRPIEKKYLKKKEKKKAEEENLGIVGNWLMPCTQELIFSHQ